MFPPKDPRLIEHEVAPLPGLTPAESSLLDLHSLLNATQVLMGELNLAGFILADDPELLAQSLRACHGWVTQFQDRVQALANIRQFPQLRAQVMSEVHRQSAAYPAQAASPDVAAVPGKLVSIFAIISQRVDELLAREGHALSWARFPAAELRRNLIDVFAAMERNSKGRYRILYNLAQQTPSDYCVSLDLGSIEGDVLAAPAVFPDVMRDLLANARKYTPPGGQISSGVYVGPDYLRLVVEDNGRGIPEADLDRVVRFGERGSNVADVRTMGGGFGLTKACMLAQRLGGRAWIASRENVGTRVTLEIPRPRH